MPRGVPKAGFRMTKKRKASAKGKFTTPSKAPKPVNMKPVNKKPVKVVEAPKTHMDSMDVPAFLEKLNEVCKSLREASAMTTHTKESELLKNFAICIERQLPPKYLNKEVEV